jgi:hypothetical protein
MGLSMCDDPCVSFGRVSVLDLTFVINARKKWLERCILKYIPQHVPNSTSILSHKIKIIPDVVLFLKKVAKFLISQSGKIKLCPQLFFTHEQFN